MLPVNRYGLFESMNVVYVEAEWSNFCANRIIIKERRNWDTQRSFENS